MAIGKEKGISILLQIVAERWSGKLIVVSDRKPIDPPPVVKLDVSPALDPNRDVLHSRHGKTSCVDYRLISLPGACFIVTCNLLAPKESLGDIPSGTLGTALTGTLVSSLHRLRDGVAREDNTSDGSFFIFSDLSVKMEGKFRLQFNLYQMRAHEFECRYIHSIVSEPFQVYSTKSWPGMNESTALTRSFSDQGVRLRLRKEPRTLLKKRGPAADDYEPRHYKKAQTVRADRGSMAESDTKQNSQQSPSERQDSIDQSYSQSQNLISRHYSQQSSKYTESPRFEDHLAKRPRSGSIQSRVPSFSDGPSITSPPMGGSNMFSEPQQQAYDYEQSPQQVPQGGLSLLNWNSYAPSPQAMAASREQYFNRAQAQMGGTSLFDSNTQRPPVMLHQTQQAGRFAQQQYGLSSQPTQNQNSAMQQRQPSFSDSYDPFTFGFRQQTMGQSGSMPPPTLGRMSSSNLGVYGPQQSMTKPSYQPNLGQNANQNMSAGSVGGMFPSNRATTSISTSGAQIPETYS